MVPIKSNSLLLYLATISISCNLIIASDAPQGSFKEQEAEDRHFLGKVKKSPLIQKKNWFFSLFSRPEPEVTSLEQFPIWKIHKYKGVELRPVQIIDVPISYDYGQPIIYDDTPVRMPHTEYGLPSAEYQPQFYTAEETTPKLNHPGKLASFLSILKSHRDLLSNLKNWKFAKLQGPTSFAVALPEPEEVPIKGIDGIKVPELPQINLPYHSSAFTTGPYLSFNVGSPLQQATYQEPAPYYGAPPLYDSYGTPLPSDAYSSVPSQPVPSFALPETTQTDYQSKTQKDTFNDQSLLQQEAAIKKVGFDETHSNKQENEEKKQEQEKQIV